MSQIGKFTKILWKHVFDKKSLNLVRNREISAVKHEI